MDLLLEQLSNGLVIRNNDTLEGIAFFDMQTVVLSKPTSNAGTPLPNTNRLFSESVINGYDIITETVKRLKEINGTETTATSTGQIFEFLVSIFGTNNANMPPIWIETATNILPVNSNKSVVLGDYANQALVINAQDSNFDSSQVFRNTTGTNTTGYIPRRQYIAPGATASDIYNIPLDGTTTLTGTLILNCSDATLGQRQYASYGFFACDALGNVFYKVIYEFAPTLAIPNVDFYFLSPTEFALKVTNNDGDAINVNAFLLLNTNKV